MILPLLLPPPILYPQLLFKLLNSSFAIVLYAHTGLYKCNLLSLFGVAHIYVFRTDHLVWDNLSHGLSLEKIDILSLQAITCL